MTLAIRPEALTNASVGRATPARAARRILMVQTQAENAGAQEVSRILSAGLAERGHEVHQLFLFRRTGAFDDAPNAIFCAEARPRNPLALARLLLRLHDTIRRLAPDAVLTFQHYGNLLGAAAARLAGAPLVVATQTSATLTTPGAARRLDRLMGSLGLFDRIVVNSRDAADAYHAYPARYRRRLVRIDHGFADKTSGLGKVEARQGLGLPQSAILLGCVARLHPLKHLDAAIRLLPGEPRWHLALAGQGEMRDILLALARSLGCADRLHLVGELPSGRIGDFLAALDVFVFPSLAETFGLAVVEAAQAGVPVVANDLEVLREVLVMDDGACALFADAADPTAFAGAVRRLLAEPTLRATLTARGRRLKERYPLDAMVDAYDALVRAAGIPTA
jgi:glycosyltransferase involved in cell wall biosynthesis